MVRKSLIGVLGVCLGVALAAGGGDAGVRTRAPQGPCRAAAVPRAPYDHVVWIVMENKGYSQVVGSPDAPYVNRLARACGLATRFYAEAHPSLPNYLAMVAGSTFGVRDDADPPTHPIPAASIFSQLGGDWRALQESMPGNCALADSGLYVAHHNPAAYFTRLRRQCLARDVPLTNPPNLSARFTLITPNECDDMHGCPSAPDLGSQIRNGDRWLSQWVPRFLASPQYKAGRTAIFVTWDEDADNEGLHVPTLVIAPAVRPGTRSAIRFDHYSLLRTTEELLGLPATLGAAATATSMRAAFRLRVSAVPR